MSFLVRKISYSKWRASVENDMTPSADAITSCMRTSGNTLSLWLIEDLTKLNDAILAIASDFRQLEAIDIVPIELSLLQESSLAIEDSPGRTVYADFRNNHRDITGLDYISLGRTADVIIKAIKQHLQVSETVRISKAQLRELLTKGIEDGKIQRCDLKPSLRQKLFPEDAVEPEPAAILKKLRRRCGDCQTLQQVLESR